MIGEGQDGRVEGCVFIFSCENSKITTHCWTTIDRRMLDSHHKKILHLFIPWLTNVLKLRILPQASTLQWEWSTYALLLYPFPILNRRILKEPRIFHPPKSEVLSHVDKCSNNTPWLYLKSIKLSLNSTKYLLSIYHGEGMNHTFLWQILVR